MALTKEELQEVIKSAIAPLNDKVAELEKSLIAKEDTSPAVEPTTEDETPTEAEVLAEELKKSLASIETRLDKIEKSRGIAKSLEEETIEVVKRKHFAVRPMDVEEAILQMNLIGHDFFMFFNAETEAMNVVYRRHDGFYGLIEPELQ